MRRIIIGVVAVLAAISCSNPVPRNYTQLNGFTQGTTYSISYHDSLARDFSTDINVLLEMVDSSMSLYRKNSVINAFNSSLNGIYVDSLLADIVSLSLHLAEVTHGAFDITVGPLVKTWGFHGKMGEIPTDETIIYLLQFIGEGMIKLDGLFLWKKHPEVKIDVNAIAQGYTVDLIAEFLYERGVNNYLVEVGGEIRTHGVSPRNQKWLVGVDKPEDNALSGENLQVIIELSGESLVTSGNYRKFFERDGVKYSHTIDPITGHPVTHTLLSATVLDKTSASADALATAFMVMGNKLTVEWLAKNPHVDAYLIYSDEQGDFQVWMSEGMKNKIAKAVN